MSSRVAKSLRLLASLLSVVLLLAVDVYTRSIVAWRFVPVDAKALDAVGITDRAARAEAYAEIEAELLRDAPFLFMGVAQLNSLRSARLQNFIFDSALWTYWDRYWVADA